MSLNLNGSMFGGGIGYDGQNQADLTATKAKAVLYVFRPFENQFKDVGLRPLIYSFDENFINTTREISDLTNRGTASAGSVIENLMSSHNLNQHLMPSINPTMQLRTSLLSDKWRFLLILTETGADLNLGNTYTTTATPNTATRRIYTGYFDDEPYNPATFGDTRRTLNPQSFMTITHKTVLGTMTSHGRFGPETSLNTFASEEIIHPTLTMSLAGNDAYSTRGLHLMTPENCINSIDSNDEGYSIAIPGAYSDISKDKGANVVSDHLEQPAHNVAQVVRGIITFQDEMINKERLSTRKVDRYFDDGLLDEGIQRSKLGRYMALPRSRRESIFDLDIDRRISPLDLDEMTNGDLIVQDFSLERPMYYETADQMEQSVTNQYSSLIASVVGPIMNSAGINEMQFEYQIARRQGRVQDDFLIHRAAPNWPGIPQADLLAMAKAVEVELVRGIFQVIYASKGDFHVIVSANATGNTTVRLSLVGQGYRNPVDFELPSFMGGLITPLLGDNVSNATNSNEIEMMYNVATGSQPIHNNFNDDDRAFMNHANGISFGDEGSMTID